jgi:hypothetical protein
VHPHPHFLPHARTRHTAPHSSLQGSVGNYRADGSAFVNLIFLVLLFGEHLDDPSGRGGVLDVCFLHEDFSGLQA